MANQIIINAKKEKGTIDRMIYGHFAEHLGRCIYEGIYVAEDSGIPNIEGFRTDVIEALKKIKIPCLRWPGGCFADEYHWKNGIGPKENRVRMINSNWGGSVENNHFGTHEFFRLCELLETEPYICGNLGSGTVQEMSEWVEYMTFDGISPMAELRKKNGREKPWRLKYFGIGNENWGCGGRMRAEYYADELNRYNLFVRDYGENKLYRIAAGPRGENDHWTEVLMREAAPFIDAIALHYYTRIKDPVVTVKRADNNRTYIRDSSVSRGSATNFGGDEWFYIMKAACYTEDLLKMHEHIMDKYDPEKKVALVVDEWGTWYECEPGTNPRHLFQQNTLRDAVSAGTSLNIFNNHCERVRMANIAQLVNVLQAPILTEGSRMVLTPTYHIFDMYKVHQDAKLLDFALLSDDYAYEDCCLKQVNASVSKDAQGNINMTICNIDHANPARVTCHIADFGEITGIKGTILTAEKMNAMNTFDDTENIKPRNFNDFTLDKNTITIDMPSKSVVLITVQSTN